MFNVAMAKVDYEGDYNYCYCTKSSHFSFVIEEALKNDIHIETSSAFDLNLIESLNAKGTVDKELYIICNGFKKPMYIENIANLINNGWKNTIPVLDNMQEFDDLDEQVTEPLKIGIRIAAEEEPKFEFYTSRLGIRYSDILPFYENKIKHNKKFSLKMLHFFINTGIRDNAYYWNELSKCVSVYCDLKAICPELDSLNIGGGFPIKNSLAFDYDYEYMAEEVIAQIKSICSQRNTPEPHIFTEFGSFTVGESGAVIYQVLDQKQQNDRERWYMVDSSFMTTLPDTWGIKQRFILLPINKWYSEYQRVFLGGLTCDSQDYYNAEAHANAIFLPTINGDSDPLYIGFFHTGAYQESVGGFGGIQHCLQPAPKHITIDIDENGEYYTRLFSKEQTYKSMLKILGY
ncbi:Biosynthetic arginine decarboxylase [bioreactor metagenome]|uniref:Biosynthetic arginine decarboxylase n=1 Tax=bioreactor metagenome TaxID=1076179 RepID=A0A645BN72_9ZZZZ